MTQLSVETCGGGGRVSTIYMDHFTRLWNWVFYYVYLIKSRESIEIQILTLSWCGKLLVVRKK